MQGNSPESDSGKDGATESVPTATSMVGSLQQELKKADGRGPRCTERKVPWNLISIGAPMCCLLKNHGEWHYDPLLNYAWRRGAPRGHWLSDDYKDPRRRMTN